jgi:hypothetical protein
LNVRYWHKADNRTAPTFVRYWSNSGHWLAQKTLALTQQSVEAPMSEIIGGALVLTWAAFVLWSIARITKSYWRGGEWKGRHIAAVAASAAIAAGLLLATKWSWVDRDTVGLGFLLALAGAVTLSAIGYAVDRE